MANRTEVIPRRPCRSCYQAGCSDGDFVLGCPTCVDPLNTGRRVVMMQTLRDGTTLTLVADDNHTGPPRITFERERRSLFRRLADFWRAWRDRPTARIVKR